MSQEKKNQTLVYEMAACLPFVKIGENKYLLGTEIRQIQIKGKGVLVKTKGGWMFVYEYLIHYAKLECLKLGTMMLKKQQTIQNVISDILKQ